MNSFSFKILFFCFLIQFLGIGCRPSGEYRLNQQNNANEAQGKTFFSGEIYEVLPLQDELDSESLDEKIAVITLRDLDDIAKEHKHKEVDQDGNEIDVTTTLKGGDRVQVIGSEDLWRSPKQLGINSERTVYRYVKVRLVLKEAKSEAKFVKGWIAVRFVSDVISQVDDWDTVDVTELKDILAPVSAGVSQNTSPEGVEYNYRVIAKSRDEFGESGFNDLRNKYNVVSLDFNKVKKKSESLVVIPNVPATGWVAASKSFIKKIEEEYGYDSGNYSGRRYGTGIKTTRENGRGKANVTHIEAFDGGDIDIVDRIRNNPRAYAQILAGSYGAVPATEEKPLTIFIAPHTKSATGADTYDGVSEREFALKYILPELQNILDGR